MTDKGVGSGTKPIVIASRGLVLMRLIELQIAFLAGGFATLFAVSLLWHLDARWGSAAALVAGCLTAAAALLVPGRLRARREARRGVPDGPCAVVDAVGATIVDGRNNRTTVRWDDVVALDHDKGDWLVGPGGERIAEVPDGITGTTPNFAYAATTARPDRFALVQQGWAFTLREGATDVVDPDRWLSSRRLGNRLDWIVLVVLTLVVVLLPLPLKVDELPLAFLEVLALGLVWMLLLRDRVVGWLMSRRGLVT